MVNILIADDDRAVCQCLQKMISWEELGASLPLVAYNGLEALQKMRDTPIDLLISDVRMPLMDGNTLSQRVKEQFPETDILLMSAYEDFQTAQLAIENGIRGYILKPVNRKMLSQLQESVRVIIARREQRQLYEQLLVSGKKTSEIFDHLNQNDSAFFQELFAEMQKSADRKTGEDLCVLMIRTLGEYIEHHSGMEYAKAQDFCRRHLSSLQAQPDVSRQFQYTSDLYLQYLSRKAIDSQNAHMVLISQVKEMIQQGYADPDFSVALLGEKFHFSPSYLSQLFNNAVGLPPSEYLTALRLSKGQELLRTTLLPITDVAKMVGYANANYFAKVFRQKLGLSPSDYRQNRNSGAWEILEEGAGADEE